jgi:hypothetical protein
MRAFLAEENAIKRDEIAARQLHALRAVQPAQGKEAAAFRRLSNVYRNEGSGLTRNSGADWPDFNAMPEPVTRDACSRIDHAPRDDFSGRSACKRASPASSPSFWEFWLG